LRLHNESNRFFVVRTCPNTMCSELNLLLVYFTV
jgi:hypothetical protein